MSRVGSRWKLSSLLKSELLQLSDVTNGTVAVRVHINAVFRDSSVVEGAVVEHQVFSGFRVPRAVRGSLTKHVTLLSNDRPTGRVLCRTRCLDGIAFSPRYATHLKMWLVAVNGRLQGKLSAWCSSPSTISPCDEAQAAIISRYSRLSPLWRKRLASLRE